MNVAQLLGIDNDNYTEEQRARILSLFGGIRQEVMESREKAIQMAKLVLMDGPELLDYRTKLAEAGVEYTPAQLDTMVKIVKVVLKTV
jgi:hypothetical protein